MTELEIGRRQDLTISEFVLLADAFGLRLADLLPEFGRVRLGETERPLRELRRILEGHPPIDADLVGPVDLPGMSPEVAGEGPYWVRTPPGGRSSQIYSALERSISRQLGVSIDEVRAAARGLWEDRIVDQEFKRRFEKARRDHSIAMQRGGALAAGPQPDPEDVRRELVDELRRVLVGG